MAMDASSTPAPRDAVEDSLSSALWSLRNHHYLSALGELRSAAAVATGEVRMRLDRLVTDLESLRVAGLTAVI